MMQSMDDIPVRISSVPIINPGGQTHKFYFKKRLATANFPIL